MKIGPLDTKPLAPIAAERKNDPAPALPRAEASAQVALSPAALAGHNVDATFDIAKVERIAQAIRDGKFTVNPEAIADKLILNAEELLGRRLS